MTDTDHADVCVLWPAANELFHGREDANSVALAIAAAPLLLAAAVALQFYQVQC